MRDERREGFREGKIENGIQVLELLIRHPHRDASWTVGSKSPDF